MKLACAFLLLAVSAFAQDSSRDWRQAVQERLPLMGHRNWIVIADSAFPEESSAGVDTIYADASANSVVEQIFRMFSHTPHVTPTVFLDKELDFVPEGDAPGITSFRDSLHSWIGEFPVEKRPHEFMLKSLSDTSQQYRVLVIKTRSILPYTTVFLRLDCAYWPPDAEARLRKAMAGK